jgi:hypothetical protein
MRLVNTQTEQGANDEPEQRRAEAGDKAGGGSSGRMWAMRALATLGAIVLILGALAVWVNRVALDSSQWSDTSVKIIQNETVQSALATYLVNEVYNSVDVPAAIQSFLPAAAKPFAGTVAEGLRAPATSATQRTLASPRVQEAWRRANERANRQLLRVIEDDKGALTTNGGAVVLDLRPLVLQVEGAAAGLGVSNRLPALPPDAGHITLLKSDQLSFAQTAVHGLKVAANFLVIVVVLIFAAAIWVSPDRRRAVRACAIALLVAGLVLIFLRRVLGDALIDQLVVDDTVRPAVHEAWWIATDPLRLITTSIVFVGLVGVLGAWVSGAGKHATSLRRWLAPYLREPWMAYGGLALIVLLLLAWSPTPAARSWITTPILIGMAVLGLEVLRRQAAREFPAEEYPR